MLCAASMHQYSGLGTKETLGSVTRRDSGLVQIDKAHVYVFFKDRLRPWREESVQLPSGL